MELLLLLVFTLLRVLQHGLILIFKLCFLDFLEKKKVRGEKQLFFSLQNCFMGDSLGNTLLSHKHYGVKILDGTLKRTHLICLDVFVLFGS